MDESSIVLGLEREIEASGPRPSECLPCFSATKSSSYASTCIACVDGTAGGVQHTECEVLLVAKSQQGD